MGPNKVLVWGYSGDPPIAAVQDALQRIGCRAFFLDQRAVLETEVELHVGSVVNGTLRVGGKTIDLSGVSAVYLRTEDWRDLPAVAAASQQSDIWRHALNVHDVLHSWADLTPALVVNRPAAMAANGSKPYQSRWIQSLGFRIPETLVTTDPSQALQFWRQHEKVVYKSLSGVRSIVSRLKEEHLARFEDISSCPTQFQEYVPGTDFRVHVVGEEVFACRIVSEADDYRYSGGRTEMHAADVPADVAALSTRMARCMDLPVAGIDLRCTPAGDWYCFEVNPSPGFTYFQELTGLPIAEAVARFLASAPAHKPCVSTSDDAARTAANGNLGS